METIVALVALPICGLLAALCLTTRAANANVRLVRAVMTSVIGFQCLVALIVAVSFAITGGKPVSISLPDNLQSFGIDLSIYYDGATAIMLCLVSFVGFIASRFSIRYLDGEAQQGRYFRWFGFTLGAVSLMVVSGNLLQYFAAWVMTSFGLHQLLLHYPERTGARRAAWTKFVVSRLGDAFLLMAIVFVFQGFGTFDMPELFERAQDAQGKASLLDDHALACWMLVLAAVTKSAQFPFHTWLPETMETPTPVSALMHAGIINAGGFLLIRLSPLLAINPSAFSFLAAIGAVTACYAGVVMMTQPSVKRGLAYSTIAQMGFMMIQCGLGAFTAAMLHIVAHSLYKAHAFLNSGNVVWQSVATVTTKPARLSLWMSLSNLILAAAATLSALWTVLQLIGLDISTKPGGLLLACILSLAMTTWAWRIFSYGDLQTIVWGFTGIFVLLFSYLASYLLMDTWLRHTSVVTSVNHVMHTVSYGIAIGFLVLFLLHVLLTIRVFPVWLEGLRVHALNGFYMEAMVHRAIQPFSPPTTK